MLFAENFVYAPWKINLEIPQGWHSVDVTKNSVLNLINNDEVSSINVLIYQFSDPITVNAFQEMR